MARACRKGLADAGEKSVASRTERTATGEITEIILVTPPLSADLLITPVKSMPPTAIRGCDRHHQTRRFLAAQFEPRNNRVTSEVLDGLRKFDHPTALIWGENDAHFGPEWAKRLQTHMPHVDVLEIPPPRASTHGRTPRTVSVLSCARFLRRGLEASDEPAHFEDLVQRGVCDHLEAHFAR